MSKSVLLTKEASLILETQKRERDGFSLRLLASEAILNTYKKPENRLGGGDD